MAFNDKQKRFVSEYIIDQNATQAAIRSGYSKKSAKRQGSRLLHNEHVKNAIQQEQNKLAIKHNITKDKIVSELAKIAFQDIRKAVTWTKDSVETKPSHLIDDVTAAAIAEVSSTKEGAKIKMFDKKAALMDLAKMLGFVNEKQDITANAEAFHFQRIEHIIINPDNEMKS